MRVRKAEQELTISTPAVKGKKQNRNRIIKWMTPRETSELTKTNIKTMAGIASL